MPLPISLRLRPGVQTEVDILGQKRFRAFVREDRTEGRTVTTRMFEGEWTNDETAADKQATDISATLRKRYNLPPKGSGA